jgi:hypothetical protein
MVTATGVRAGSGRLPSHACTLRDLAESLVLTDADRAPLRLGPGWTRRWTAGFATVQGVVVHPIAELREGVPASTGPVRRFSWRTDQRHRPGLQYLVSTGRHHGFESLAEQRLLLALDFLGVDEVLAQPFELRMTTADGWARHVPDFRATGRDGTWLIDVRPGHRVKPDDRMRFAAAEEFALVMGWRFVVVTGWRPGVIGTIDALSAQRRPLADPLRLQPQLLRLVDGGPMAFRDLVAGTSVPVVARAHALHLIWHRRLGIDLAQPLNDDTLVWPVSPRQDRP